MDRTSRLGKLFKKKVGEILLNISKVPFNAATVDKVVSAEADF